MTDGLKARLACIETGDGGSNWHRNPDGPEALAAALAVPEVAALVDASRAVVGRWDSKDWKAPPTADVMNELRAALAALQRD